MPQLSHLHLCLNIVVVYSDLKAYVSLFYAKLWFSLTAETMKEVLHSLEIRRSISTDESSKTKRFYNLYLKQCLKAKQDVDAINEKSKLLCC